MNLKNWFSWKDANAACLLLQTFRNQWKSDIKADFFSYPSYFKFIKLHMDKYLQDQDYTV